ncbi:hypothetical protein EHW97_02700 [Aeromicrobium camelliae]|uniref:WD40 repeat domain-containing protein n=1 Tax=Aeromicrobium camelliae TaxID=1538144 RepID=A0A3N6X6M7_9ACTN|nr:hypothetical protein [Aeromicrobium camelliae]RQN09765.1 hypothetical protein EHW97_02700 [Aeromicrobium camelliae]
MNPRHRRMLIPGLLIALLVIVAVASLTGRADASEPVSTIGDPRITESSGLAVSAAHDDLAYTLNDSGHEPLVFAVRISTGDTVGVTRLAGVDVVDPEAIALHAGRLWVADTGDNAATRNDIALLAFDEPGPGDHVVRPDRHPVRLEESADVEALLIQPRDGSIFLVTKSIGAADVYRADATTPLNFQRTDLVAPPVVTDGAFAPDGSSIALVSYLGIHVLDPVSWEVRASLPLPPLEQAESLAFVDPGTVLVGSEGSDSPLFAVALPAAPIAVAAFAAMPAAGLALVLALFRSLSLR